MSTPFDDPDGRYLVVVTDLRPASVIAAMAEQESIGLAGS